MDRFKQSVEQFSRSVKVLAGGVSSTLRAAMKPTPLYVDRGKGSRFWDVDGNEYIDYIMGYGPLILGHSNSEFVSKMTEQLSLGQQYGMQHKGEIELAEKIVQLVPGVEKVAFSGSGTEAVMLALRLSRAFTGRQKIIRFEGHYHGWSDGIFTSFKSPDMTQSTSESKAGTIGQSMQALEDILIVPWNDPEALLEVIDEHDGEIAAIITEPVMCNSGCIKPKVGYLEYMRKISREKGIVLIFDEVITGFRVSSGGATKRLNIQPDLITMGKALAGGYPLSAVGGRSDIMDLISDGIVSHLGTLNGNPLATTAGITTLNILNNNNAKAYEKMERIATNLVKGINDVLDKKGVPHLINQFGSVFHLMFTDEKEVTTFDQFNKRDAVKYAQFAEKALMKGLAVRPNGLWYVSTAHTDEDVNSTLEIINAAINEI